MSKQTRTMPEELRTDRAMIALLIQWRNCHLRHRVCRRRVNWQNHAAYTIERKRRKEKWELVARVLEIERTVILLIARATHHPEISSTKKRLSTLRQLTNRYIGNRYRTHHLKGAPRERMMYQRELIVKDIRNLERAWMVVAFTAVHPNERIPSPIPLHARELRPRKLKSASKRIAQEVA